MADTRETLFHAKVLHNKQVAMDKIIDCVRKYPDIHYPFVAFCEIALKFRDKESLKQGVVQLEKLCKKKGLAHRTFSRYKAFLYALEGNEGTAIQILEKDLARYPKESREKMIAKIKGYSAMAKVI